MRAIINNRQYLGIVSSHYSGLILYICNLLGLCENRDNA